MTYFIDTNIAMLVTFGLAILALQLLKNKEMLTLLNMKIVIAFAVLIGLLMLTTFICVFVAIEVLGTGFIITGAVFALFDIYLLYVKYYLKPRKAI